MSSFPSFAFIQKIVIDVGSAYTKVIKANKASVIPTCVLQQRTGEGVAIGRRAFSLLGKVPPQFTLSFPVAGPTIQNTPALASFLSGVCDTSKWRLQVIFVQCSAYSQVYQQTVAHILQSQGIVHGKFCSVEPSIARQESKESCVLIDLGAETTKITLWDRRRAATQYFLQGGAGITRAIQQYLEENGQVAVGWQSAEEVKYSLTLQAKRGHRHFTVRGKQITSGLPIAQRLTEEELLAIVLPLYQRWFALISQKIVTLLEARPELADKPITYLVFGGAAQQAGIAEVLGAALRSEVRILAQPQLATVYSAVQSLL